VKAFAMACTCRKPNSGMLEQAAREWPIDIDRSFLIGDKDHDMAAAAAFKIRGVKFDSSLHSLPDLVRQEIAAHKSLRGSPRT
jgi:D-glycero-D-manno-heptose 1,7-bisphosphate phosphatase